MSQLYWADQNYFDLMAIKGQEQNGIRRLGWGWSTQHYILIVIKLFHLISTIRFKGIVTVSGHWEGERLPGYGLGERERALEWVKCVPGVIFYFINWMQTWWRTMEMSSHAGYIHTRSQYSYTVGNEKCLQGWGGLTIHQCHSLKWVITKSSHI